MATFSNFCRIIWCLLIRWNWRIETSEKYEKLISCLCSVNSLAYEIISIVRRWSSFGWESAWEKWRIQSHTIGWEISYFSNFKLSFPNQIRKEKGLRIIFGADWDGNQRESFLSLFQCHVIFRHSIQNIQISFLHHRGYKKVYVGIFLRSSKITIWIQKG